MEKRKIWLWGVPVAFLLLLCGMVGVVYCSRFIGERDVAAAAEPTSTLGLSIYEPTVAPTPTSMSVPPNADLVPYEEEGGIPYSGTVWSADVAPDEIEVLTGGPASIGGVTLPGGIDRGSVIVLLPNPTKVISYTVTGLVAGANWHGAYRPTVNPTDKETWNALVADRVAAMQQPPNCTDGKGCSLVDVLVVAGPSVVDQWTVEK